MWKLDCEESWAPKNWCCWTVVLEKTLESPLDCKEIQPVHPEGDKSWVFIGRTEAEAETPILWPPHGKSWLVGKDPDAKGLGIGGEGDDRGWDGWMASPTWWAWVWANSGSLWWTGRPGVLRFMGLQRVGHDWVTELNWTESCWRSGKASSWGSRGEVRHESEGTKTNHKPYLFLTLSFYCSHSDVYNVVASLVAQLVKNLPAMPETGFDSWVGKIPWRRERLPTLVFWPGEFHGLYCPWGCKESDMTFTFTFHIMICWKILK